MRFTTRRSSSRPPRTLVPHAGANFYCPLCYKYETDKDLTKDQRRKACIKTKLGCNACNVRVCAKCEKNGIHRLHRKD